MPIETLPLSLPPIDPSSHHTNSPSCIQKNLSTLQLVGTTISISLLFAFIIYAF